MLGGLPSWLQVELIDCRRSSEPSVMRTPWKGAWLSPSILFVDQGQETVEAARGADQGLGGPGTAVKNLGRVALVALRTWGMEAKRPVGRIGISEAEPTLFSVSRGGVSCMNPAKVNLACRPRQDSDPHGAGAAPARQPGQLHKVKKSPPRESSRRLLT